MDRELKSFRITPETEKIILDLMKEYPDDYPTGSDVIRAGVIALKRWKQTIKNQ